MKFVRLLISAMLVLLVGCATGSQRVWEGRIGKFTYEQAVAELGEPTKTSKTQGGVRIAEWRTQRGSPGRVAMIQPLSNASSPHSVASRAPVVIAATPERYLRLTFAPDGRLIAWARDKRYSE